LYPTQRPLVLPPIFQYSWVIKLKVTTNERELEDLSFLLVGHMCKQRPIGYNSNVQLTYPSQ